MQAIVLQGAPKASLVTDRPYPKLRPGYLLVDVKAVALNPADWKHIDAINDPGATSGCDFSGVVAETGVGYSKAWKVGDRICGFCHGGNKFQHEDGAFAERIAVKADVVMRIPDNMSFEDAATLGVAIASCGQGLFQEMGLKTFSNSADKGETVLVYGGSSATGAMAIQLLRLAGHTAITTCSPHNFGFVKSLGATAVFDYNDPDCAKPIRDFTGNNVKYIWDTISLPASAQICAQAISPGGTYGTLIKVDFPRTDVKVTWSLGYTMFGEPIEKRGLWMHKPQDFDFMKDFIAKVEPLLHQGLIKTHPTQVGQGLENVLEGIDLLRQGKVSGRKLVYVL